MEEKENIYDDLFSEKLRKSLNKSITNINSTFKTMFFIDYYHYLQYLDWSKCGSLFCFSAHYTTRFLLLSHSALNMI